MELNSYRHFYLYAKGWYHSSSDVMDDLRLIHNHRVGHTMGKDSDVMWVLFHLVSIHLLRVNPFRIQDFLGKLDPNHMYHYHSKKPFDQRFMETALSFLGLLSEEDLGFPFTELGEPDPEVLPLSDGTLARLEAHPSIHELEEKS